MRERLTRYNRACAICCVLSFRSGRFRVDIYGHSGRVHFNLERGGDADLERSAVRGAGVCHDGKHYRAVDYLCGAGVAVRSEGLINMLKQTNAHATLAET